MWSLYGFRFSTEKYRLVWQELRRLFQDPPIAAQTGAGPILRMALVQAREFCVALALLSLAYAGQAVAQEVQYTLDTGDQLRITVFGHEDLSGEFKVGSTGSVTMPLIGEISAKGLTLQQLEVAIIDELKPGYLKNPQVSAEVIGYRPFYIIGEVRNPGTYPYVGSMRIVNAIAIAGGFTYRARESDMRIIRAKGDGTPKNVGPDTFVLPGDVIEVLERFF